MDKKKYVYKSYDYSFLAPSYKWTILANKVYSSTLASYIVPFNITDYAMDLPTGEIFYFEPTTTTYSTTTTQYNTASSGYYTTNTYSYT